MADAADRPILVTGSHRSGSTWVGRVLSIAPGVAYISEPFHPAHRPGLCGARFEHWFQYVTEANEERFRDPLLRTLRFRYELAAELSAVRGPRDLARLARDWGRFQAHRLRRRRPLMKDPIALLSAPWLAATFHMQVVVLIRHPAAFASSLKRLDWRFDFSNLLDQDHLIADGVLGFVDEIERFARREHDIIDEAALLWKILYDVVDRYRQTYGEWFFLRHEDLSLEPSEEFSSLLEKLGLPFTDPVLDYIDRTTRPENPREAPRGQAHLLQRDSRSNIKSWKSRLDTGEVERIRERAEPVASRFYSDDDW